MLIRAWCLGALLDIGGTRQLARSCRKKALVLHFGCGSPMKELDFKFFGIDPDNSILLRLIIETLSELASFGDLSLRAAWLFYGSISKASEAFNLPLETFRAAVEPKQISTIKILASIQKLAPNQIAIEAVP